MRTRMVIAFIVVALLSAVASSWFHTLIGAYRLPAWLDDVIFGPGWLRSLVHSDPGQPAPHPVRHTALLFFGVEAGLLLAMITTVVIAAYRPVLLPVRRLARAAQRMSGGDLSVRIQPRGRGELAQLVSSFNGMASALQDKVGELEQMTVRARQFAGGCRDEHPAPYLSSHSHRTSSRSAMTPFTTPIMARGARLPRGRPCARRGVPGEGFEPPRPLQGRRV